MKYYCLTCDKEISEWSAKYGAHRCRSCSKKGKRSGMYVDGRTNKKYHCIDCNQSISVSSGVYGQSRCQSCNKKRLFQNSKNIYFLNKSFTKEHKRKISLAHGGTGIPYENTEYGTKFNFFLKEKVRIRDNRKCRICSKLEIDCNRKLDVHHIDYDKKNNKLNNLISLCIGCHTKTGKNREYWETYLQIKGGIENELFVNFSNSSCC